MLALCSRSEGSGIVRQPWFISAGRKTNTARTTRLAHQVDNGLALHYHQTGSVMIASARLPKKELMQKNIRMSSTLVMTAEAELELTRARAALEAVLTRAGITAECAGNRSRRKLRFANNRHGRLLGIREAGNDSWPPSSTGALTDDRLRSSGASSSS